ncbi:MAG: tRNA (adenosine(37)-N6)-threonylcarbamoyltransferase complex transferase subunit TsaD [Planctomycetes bacterium]|nr:tRNA (adenosine(37)-N6)-threonylcarbamoyltransferase complex transferase subunit TsaD [Planctomycetota bacterium]
MRVLGLESSCDETAAAVVESGRILSSVVASQVDLHARFGGVVPEIASRAHVERVTSVVRAALADAGAGLADMDGIAVTTGPGLIGALLVGISAAKALAWASGLPLVGVNHIEAHVHSVRMEHPDVPDPHVVLVASGGHTRLFRADGPARTELLGSTTDDAAGEAFDKVSAILGLGYPGGPAIERAAEGGNSRAFDFPRTLLGAGSLDMSFSGVKTAVLYAALGQDVKKGAGSVRPGVNVADVAASFQEAVVDVLVEKTMRAARRAGARAVGIAGGVASNHRLRKRLEEAARAADLAACWPPPALCTDNAAMIAGLGALRLAAGASDGLAIDAAA